MAGDILGWLSNSTPNLTQNSSGDLPAIRNWNPTHCCLGLVWWLSGSLVWTPEKSLVEQWHNRICQCWSMSGLYSLLHPTKLFSSCWLSWSCIVGSFCRLQRLSSCAIVIRYKTMLFYMDGITKSMLSKCLLVRPIELALYGWSMVRPIELALYGRTSFKSSEKETQNDAQILNRALCGMTDAL